MATNRVKNDVLKLHQLEDGRWQAHLWSGQDKRYYTLPKATNADIVTCIKSAIAFMQKNDITNNY